MTIVALALLLSAALLHAVWNLVLKQTPERFAVLWWALVVSALCSLPLLFVGEPLPARVWPFVVGSAVFEALYFGLLAWAYGSGDFSLVYPIARGSAPALLAVWSVLFLGEQPSLGGVLGIGVVVVGLVVVGSSALRSTSSRSAQGSSIVLAGCVAVCISLYSAIDGAAVQFAEPAPYIAAAFGVTALFATPVVLWRSSVAQLGAVWRGAWRSICTIGALTLVSYLLVLWAYSQAPVSYGGAVREVSIVFAALLGRVWLGEAVGAMRAVGAALIVGGIFLIALAT